MIWNQLMTAPDGLRKRMALAFTEIFVVSANDIGSNWPDLMMAQYWDMLVAGVTGNFRKLLEDVTLNPAMGYYLNTKGNQKENAQGRQPDENYAREVMQLMTIGLYQLNPDGTLKTGADGAPLDTYTQDDVTNLARVFTGYDLDIRADEHGAFTPSGQTYAASRAMPGPRGPMALDGVEAFDARRQLPRRHGAGRHRRQGRARRSRSTRCSTTPTSAPSSASS